MLYPPLGRTGLIVSRLSLGTMTFADEIAALDAAAAPTPGYPRFVVDVVDQPIARALAARPGTN